MCTTNSQTFKTLIFIMLFMVGWIYLTKKALSRKQNANRYAYGEDDFFVNSKGCRIRKFDPFDPTIIEYYWTENNLLDSCDKPSYLRVVNDRIYLNTTQIKKDFGNVSVKCFYRIIDVTGEIPNKTSPLVFGKRMVDDYLRIECFDRNVTLFLDFIALVPEKPHIEETRRIAIEQNLSTTPLNVIMVAIDSVSKLNFVRQLPRTYKYLKNVIKPFEFHGYTKVADNTFVNLVPLLTGHFLSFYRSFGNMSNTYYDDLDLVWKEYQLFGYRTLYAEDSPSIGTFTYNKWGFKDPPTDYSLRPIALAVENDPWRTANGDLCFGHVSEVEFYYNYLRKFLRKMDNRPTFSFTFISRITHDDLNMAGQADGPTLELFQDLHESGALNKSALIFFSDHGIRFGEILNTYIGKVEERMPFMFQYYPRWFLDEHPGFEKNLSINQHRLMSPFDVHKTLQNVLTLSSKDGKTGFELKNKGNGLSLFEEIPPERTCKDAYIAPHWCTCHDHYKISSDNPKAIQAAQAIVKTVNTWLTDGRYSELCAELHLEEITTAYITVPQIAVDDVSFGESDNPNYVPQGVDHFYYLITLKVSPSSAMFEATVQDKNGTLTVFGELSRINRYGHQSWCIYDPTMKKFCYCTTPYKWAT